MLFNNKIAVDKNQQKLYNKGRELIENRARGLDNAVAFQESQNIIHNSLVNRPIGKAALRRQVFSRRDNATKVVTQKLFMENLFDIYSESLLLDDYFKRANHDNLFNLCQETFNNLMEQGLISWNSIKNESSVFTKNLYALCEDVAKKKAEENINFDTVKKQTVKDDALISEKDKDEEVDEDDKKKVDDKTKEDKKNVAEVVKDKVTDTIKKEKEKAEEEEQDDEDIKENSKTDKEKEEETSDDEDSADTDDDTESSNDDSDKDDSKEDEDDKDDDSDKDKKDDDKENNDDDKEEDDSDEDSSKDKDDDKDDEKKSESYSFRRLRRPNKIRNTSLFRSIEINVANKFFNEKAKGIIAEDVEMNMDMIFAESLSYYTLLETFNTIGLIDLRPSQLKSICKELILK